MGETPFLLAVSLLAMLMITSRQNNQPQYSLALEYHLIHNNRNDLPAIYYLVGGNSTRFHFYDTNIP